MQAKIDKLNAYLSGVPKGRIIAKDINVRLVQMGEHTLALQQVSYHVGFTRQP